MFVRRIHLIRQTARAEGETLLTDPKWVAGVVAYRAEGAKATNELLFANSDPAMINLFIRWTGRYLQIPPDRLTVRMHLHSGQDETDHFNYWSAVTAIPIEQFRKGFIKPEGTGHRKNRLYHGTASVRVTKSTTAFHRVMGWIDAVTCDVVG